MPWGSRDAEWPKPKERPACLFLHSTAALIVTNTYLQILDSLHFRIQRISRAYIVFKRFKAGNETYRYVQVCTGSFLVLSRAACQVLPQGQFAILENVVNRPASHFCTWTSTYIWHSIQKWTAILPSLMNHMFAFKSTCKLKYQINIYSYTMVFAGTTCINHVMHTVYNITTHFPRFVMFPMVVMALPIVWILLYITNGNSRIHEG